MCDAFKEEKAEHRSYDGDLPLLQCDGETTKEALLYLNF